MPDELAHLGELAAALAAPEVIQAQVVLSGVAD